MFQMSWDCLPRPVRLLCALCCFSIIIAPATAISPIDPSLNDQLAGLNVSSHVEVDLLINLWGNNAALPGFEPQHQLHGRVPHPRALGELRELFSRQVKCGGSTCPTGACCTKAKSDGKDICCPGRCCVGWCCGNDDRCGDTGGCIWPTKWETRTTTVTSTSTVTQASSVSGTTTSWVTSKITSTFVATTSNIATATQIETKWVTVTDPAATATQARRAIHVDAAPAVDQRHAHDGKNTEAALERIYYLRRSPKFDPLASALSNRGLSILRRDWVTSTRVDTKTNQVTSTVVNTVTNWRVLTSTSMLTDTITSVSYIGAATTVTSTTTSTTRVPPDFTPPPSSTGSTDTSSPTAQANTNGGGGSQSDGKPIGAIVGGTVGGVVGLLIIGAIVFIMKRRRRWAAQDAENEQKTRAPMLGMPEGKPDYGNNGDAGRGAVGGWGESTTAGATSASAPSWTSDPASRTGSGMAMSGQWQPPPVAASAPMTQHNLNEVSGDQAMYAHEHRSLSGQWYPQQQPQQLDSGEVMEMPGHDQGLSQGHHGNLQQGHGYGQGQRGQEHWRQGQGEQRY